MDEVVILRVILTHKTDPGTTHEISYSELAGMIR